MGLRYGVYFIPRVDDSFYDVGTRIIGYDIRRKSIINEELCGIMDSANSRFGIASYFGFHATIRGIFKTDDLATVQDQLSRVARRMSPIRIDNSFIGSFDDRNRSVFFSPQKAAKQELAQMHERVVKIVDKCRLREYISEETRDILPTLNHTQLELLNKHGDPRVLEEYVFHFTLANRATTQQLAAVDELILAHKRALVRTTVVIDNICLVVQRHGSPFWEIEREFALGGGG